MTDGGFERAAHLRTFALPGGEAAVKEPRRTALGLLDQVFGGWQISGVTTLQSGTPFTVVNSALDFSGFNQFKDRPDVIGTGRLPQDNRNPDAAFSRAFKRFVGVSPSAVRRRESDVGPPLAR